MPAVVVTQTGGPLDWEAVYGEQFKPVWRFMARLGVRSAELEDLVHEVFLTAFRRVDAFDAERPILPWLMGIAFRLASDNRRRATTTREVLEASPGVDMANSGPTLEANVARREARHLLDEVLDSMDLEKRAVFVMYEYDGVPVPEIARAVQIPVATAHSRLRLARQQFEAGVKRLRARVADE